MSDEPINAHILDMVDTREAFGRISVFYAHRDARCAYEKWCGEWFGNWEDPEAHRLVWAKEIYEESIYSKFHGGLKLGRTQNIKI